MTSIAEDMEIDNNTKNQGNQGSLIPDLEALRLAALSTRKSRKEKEEPEEKPQNAQVDDEREEGELSETESVEACPPTKITLHKHETNDKISYDQITRTLMSEIYAYGAQPADFLEFGIPLEIVAQFSKELHISLPPNIDSNGIPASQQLRPQSLPPQPPPLQLATPSIPPQSTALSRSLSATQTQPPSTTRPTMPLTTFQTQLPFTIPQTRPPSTTLRTQPAFAAQMIRPPATPQLPSNAFQTKAQFFTPQSKLSPAPPQIQRSSNIIQSKPVSAPPQLPPSPTTMPQSKLTSVPTQIQSSFPKSQTQIQPPSTTLQPKQLPAPSQIQPSSNTTQTQMSSTSQLKPLSTPPQIKPPSSTLQSKPISAQPQTQLPSTILQSKPSPVPPQVQLSPTTLQSKPASVSSQVQVTADKRQTAAPQAEIKSVPVSRSPIKIELPAPAKPFLPVQHNQKVVIQLSDESDEEHRLYNLANKSTRREDNNTNTLIASKMDIQGKETDSISIHTSSINTSPKSAPALPSSNADTTAELLQTFTSFIEVHMEEFRRLMNDHRQQMQETLQAQEEATLRAKVLASQRPRRSNSISTDGRSSDRRSSVGMELDGKSDLSPSEETNNNGKRSLPSSSDESHEGYSSSKKQKTTEKTLEILELRKRLENVTREHSEISAKFEEMRHTKTLGKAKHTRRADKLSSKNQRNTNFSSPRGALAHKPSRHFSAAKRNEMKDEDDEGSHADVESVSNGRSSVDSIMEVDNDVGNEIGNVMSDKAISERPLLEEHDYPRWKPYVSPLRNFKSYRLSTNFKEIVGLPGYKHVAWNNKINVQLCMCKYELFPRGRGRCNDRFCKANHFRHIMMTEDEIIQDLISIPYGNDDATKVEYLKGVETLVSNLRHSHTNTFEDMITQIVTYRQKFAEKFRTRNNQASRGSNGKKTVEDDTRGHDAILHEILERLEKQVEGEDNEEFEGVNKVSHQRQTDRGRRYFETGKDADDTQVLDNFSTYSTPDVYPVIVTTDDVDIENLDLDDSIPRVGTPMDRRRTQDELSSISSSPANSSSASSPRMFVTYESSESSDEEYGEMTYYRPDHPVLGDNGYEQVDYHPNNTNGYNNENRQHLSTETERAASTTSNVAENDDLGHEVRDEDASLNLVGKFLKWWWK
ncbi:7565_t:CDS:2 [Paraglomus occultum]|uniref:7565_t:CDS:1 n=1 Tax=Paraglomus occultum TaxID=144539 RepID=A0A9N9AZP3_9GLOM|nr:7565_t:CDS:2 [Paraglomus occultum]